MVSSSKATTAPTVQQWMGEKLKDYLVLTKYRLSLTVVFSAVIGYALAFGTQVNGWYLLLLGIAGFLITGGANGINQVLEKDSDKLMKRTADRPVATGRMTVTEGLLVSGIAGVVGITILYVFFNELSALIGALSLLLYAFVYTPLKKISPIAILVGALPGALPPVIGWVAATGVWNYEAYLLFSIQFLWQFPHFWAIGWLGAEEYAKAGFRLVPTPETRNRHTALQVISYIVALIIVSLLPSFFSLTSPYFMGVAVVLGLGFLAAGIQLYQRCDQKAALRLMLASIIYLPLLQIAMVLDRLLLSN